MSWIKNRLKERTSWDGFMLIGMGVLMLMMPIDLAAYAAIAWGAWTIVKSQQNNIYSTARRSYQAQDVYESIVPWTDQTPS